MINTFLVNFVSDKSSTQVKKDMLRSMASILQFSEKDRQYVIYLN